MLKTFTLWQSNREEAEKWNSVLTPTASLELSKIKSAVSSHPLVVTKMSSTVAVVCRNSEDRHYACVRSVNLADGTCDCGMWMQRQIPCKHAIATIQALGQQLSYSEPTFGKQMLTKTWKELYKEEDMTFLYPGDGYISSEFVRTDFEPLLLEVRQKDLTVSQSNKRFNSLGQDGTTPSSQPASQSKKRKYLNCNHGRYLYNHQ